MSTIEITQVVNSVVIDATPEVIELGIVGPQGPPGAPGAPGGATANYEHVQAVPASTWSVAHGLGFRPNVFVEDTTGRDVEGDLAHIDANNLTLTFSAAFSGVAYCS